jgi:hypothetical protein
MAATWDWVEIRTHDVEATAKFYEELFGWKVTDRVVVDDSPVWLFETGGQPRVEDLSRGGIWLRKGEAPRIVVYVLVDDLDTSLRRVVELGGSVLEPPLRMGRGMGALVADPGGVTFAIYQFLRT